MRILQCVTGNFDIGGLSQIVYRWGKELAIDDIVFDYHCRNYYPDNKYTKKIKMLGGEISYPDKDLSGLKKEKDYFRRQKELIKKNKYDIVHVHSDTAYNMIKGAFVAKKCGVKKIILHSHSSGIDRHSSRDFSFKYLIRIVLHKTLRRLLPLFGDIFCACSETAADWMYFGLPRQKVIIIYNAIDVKKYQFNKNFRDELRKRYQLEDFIVAGNVGRFVYQKNHSFIVRLAEYAQDYAPQIKFVLVGSGELFDSIKHEVNSKEINNILFTGNSNEVEKWMQTFDVFILPSHFEGLPVVGIEAQASGLPCIFSATIDSESAVVENVIFLPASEKMLKSWCDAIIALPNSTDRANNARVMENSVYNIKNSMDQLKEVYST